MYKNKRHVLVMYKTLYLFLHKNSTVLIPIYIMYIHVQPASAPKISYTRPSLLL